jgi:hypothetical protein
MTILWIVAGLCLVILALRDVFQTLFHPAGRGAMSDYISGVTWRFFRHNPFFQPKLTLAGPWAILNIMGSWVLLTLFGFACIYRPFVPNQFVVAVGLDKAQYTGFVDALTISIESLITITGEFIPKTKTLSLLMGIEGIIGFALLTASVSWLLSVYPVLEGQRTLAHEVTLLHQAERDAGTRVTDLPESDAQTVIWGFAAEVASLRNDLTQFPITYYFQAGDSHTGIGGAFTYLYELGEEASKPHRPPSVRMSGVALGGAVSDLLDFVAMTFLGMPKGDKRAILERISYEHRRPQLHLGENMPRRAA